MDEVTANVDWIAVVAGTVASFLLGWIWYAPGVFGRKWAAGVGVELGSAAGVPVAAMVTQLAATFLLAWVVGITATQGALILAILIALTVALFVVSAGLFAKKSSYAIAVEAGFVLAMVAVMILAQAVL